MMHFATAGAWEEWLASNHKLEGGVWLKIARKHSPLPLITIGQAIEVALCYGWIDSQRKSFDQQCFLQLFSHRRRGSPWSQINVELAEDLIAAGRMREPGLEEIAAARADGRWDAAYTAQRNATVPSDLMEALVARPTAPARFESLNKTDRYRLMLPIFKAVDPETRALRVQKVIAELLSQKEPST